jgi:transcriptional regulator of met regulon
MAMRHTLEHLSDERHTSLVNTARHYQTLICEAFLASRDPDRRCVLPELSWGSERRD